MDWDLPAPIERIRRKPTTVPAGDRQLVEILSAALSGGLWAIEAVRSAALGLSRPSGRRDLGDPGPPARACTSGADRDP